MSSDDVPFFLKELSPKAVLTSTIMRKSVYGADSITRVVSTSVKFYGSMTLTFKGAIGAQEFVGFKVRLTTEENLNGVITISRGEDKLISDLDLSYSPLDGVLALSKNVGDILGLSLADTFLKNRDKGT